MINILDVVNKVICGDCMEIMANMEDECVDSIVTDIPYNISQESNGLRNLEYGAWDHQAGMEMEWMKAMFRLYKKTIIVFCGNPQISDIYKIFKAQGLAVRLLHWERDNPTVMNCDKLYIQATDSAIYGKKPGATFNPEYKKNVFRYPSPHCTERYHPCQKPLGLMKEMIMDISEPGDIIFDPFAGSGTTLVAAKSLGMRYLGIERDPKYVSSCEERLRQEYLNL